MTRYGFSTAIYLQKELLPKIKSIVKGHRDIFKSKNSFINCAIVREIRRIEENDECEKN